MRRICIAALCMAWLFAFAGVSAAQAPVPSLELPNTEVYGGFVVTDPDYGQNWGDFLLYGFEAGVSKGLTERFWITGTFDFVRGNPSIPNSGPVQNPNFPPGAPVEMHIKQISLTVGPKYYFLTGNFRPYAMGQIGYARQTSDGFYGRDHEFQTPPGVRRVESGFTYRFGGGLEWQFHDRWYWRVVSWDWQPQPWGRSKPFYTNLGSGIGYRF